MLGNGERDARRTDRYLDGLMDAEERGAERSPVDADLDPAVMLATRELRAGLVRVHPSFRFEERLAHRLADTAVAMGGSGVAAPASGIRASILPALASTRRGLPARPVRPLVVGGVSVASAAISLGAMYVAWRWSRSQQPLMVRAARAARSGRSHTSGPSRHAGALHGILG
jgi:hypothetical protein